ncbi:hypothetical protein KML24008_10270 [Alistipes onderdonkii]|uniref:hypothetical protein n=1 Tax=Alistipes onderdonkii TaxID=328813 RepID=UPI000381A1A2|nr:hypothetical protein [Alistipes onderdonkii]UWN62636.1 hypothetical protein NQ559_02850 [Alistipes onderdonkii]
MKEFEFIGYVVPLRNRMFRYAQSLLLCADEAEEVTHDLLERLWTRGGGCGRIGMVFPGGRAVCGGRIDKFI